MQWKHGDSPVKTGTDAAVSKEGNADSYLGRKMTHHYWGARGVIVIVVGNGHGDSSLNPGRDWLHFT